MSIRGRISFKGRVFLGCLTVAMVPLLLSSLVMMRIFTSSLKRQGEETGAAQLEELRTCFSDFLQNCGNICEKLTRDPSVCWAMIDNKTVDYQKDLYLSMYQAVQEIYGHAGFCIYDAGGRLRFTTDTVKWKENLPVNWGLLRKLSASEGLAYYKTESYLYASDGEVLLQGGCALGTANGMRTGYVVLELSQQDFDRLLTGYYAAEDTVAILDSHRNLVYCSRADYGEKEIKEMIDRIAGESSMGFFDISTRTLWTRVEPGGFYILFDRPAPISQTAVRLMGSVVFAVSLIGLVLCLLISGVLTRGIAYPVAQQQKSLNQTTLKLYQTQLNPHFLYNTLDSIKWNARINQIPEIAVMAENLAVILRKSISGQPFVCLREELEMIESYIRIQKVRFTGRFLYETEIPDGLEECVIPKMILQPLVENAIVHGFDGCENGYICIYGVKKDGKLYLSVTDDGCGMSEEMLQWLNSPNPERREGHLGIYNVMQILKIYYGEEYGVRAESSGEGTTVTLILPERKEEQDV